MDEKHKGPHCAGYCEGAAYQIEIERLRTENERLRQSQPVPEGWRVDLEGTGHVVMRAPNGSFAVIGPPEHEEARLSVVSEFLSAMLAAAPKPEAHTVKDSHVATVSYNLVAAEHEGAIREKLKEMGWTPPNTEGGAS
ncbi:hypothetical protein [Thioalkalivibrio sp. ARh3]|uniref:hypothetical protein n=1 Tax=Thioalkalivibrio sp. ARh3 TaxID=1158148 RepID=UPI000360FFA7|nr:hypothetical protein [Thioalkalivibrio sp. ARh3]